MKIALLTDGIWPFVIGGMQKHSFYLCKYLAQHGIQVELYHTAKQPKNIQLDTIFTSKELKHITPHFIPWPPSDKFPGHYIRTSFKYSRLVYEAFCKQPPVDLVYAKGLAGWYLLKQKAAGKELPAVYLNVHGYEYFQKTASLKNKIEQLMLRSAFCYVNRQADYIYSYGGNITDIIKKRIGVPGKIIEIPTGIEADFLTYKTPVVNQPRHFVYLGRYERRKGIVELSEAIRQLSGTNDFMFHFVGNIPEHEQIKSPKVQYYGVLDNKVAIKTVLQKADVLICPSYAEGMPNVILEGMASGCAIIATNVGAVNIQVDDRNGWLIQPGSVPDLKQAMEECISMPNDLMLKKRTASISRIRDEFLWQDIIGLVIKSFNQTREAERETIS